MNTQPCGPDTMHRQRAQSTGRRRSEALAARTLAAACTLLLLAGCPSRNRDFADAAALANVQSPLAWTVNAAQATHRLPTSTLEDHAPAPGNQFVVLDVSVRNRDVGPQVLSEGKLIAMDESNLQTFDTPVTVLSDDYLSLQVLAPAQSLRGKIAYEVPEHLSGVLYWSPGNGSGRILLNLATPMATQRTLAQAGQDDDAAVSGSTPPPDDASIDTTRMQAAARAPSNGDAVQDPPIPAQVASVQRRSQHGMPTTIAKAGHPIAAHAAETAADSRLAAPDVATDAPGSNPSAAARAARSDTAPADTISIADNAPASTAAQQAQGAPREVATLDMSRPALDMPAVTLPPTRTAALRPGVDKEQVRRQACSGLVSRNDPAEKADGLAFFAQSCRDFALPSRWRPPVARRSLLARATDLLARMVVKPHVVRVSDCGTSASAADRLVCADPALSAMDQRLAQSVARASAHVDDPAALQRAQAQWRGRIRNSCDTRNCLQRAYGHRIAQLDAMTPMRP